MTLVSYEATETPRAFIDPVAAGDSSPKVPLFLQPGVHVAVPLERTYTSAYDALPARWRRVLKG